MIEICNCDSLPVITLDGDSIPQCSLLNCKTMKQQQQLQQASDSADPAAASRVTVINKTISQRVMSKHKICKMHGS
ncbi:hypothetical protein CDL15_Pgr015327 [Punica granatum]|uniref:Uncharacterized protein n=1 Tax=Punica granatum TaxID=22663 RepID=A0A218W1A1_PUNGR|nr:hypothetical protein CDL15_Pgr015327 [Punica granatum]